MLNLPHIWTPRQTLWLPGMRLNPLGRFGVCASCCEEFGTCVGCIADTAPSQFLVEIAGVAGDTYCTNCADANGSFVVDRDATNDPVGNCTWKYGTNSVCDAAEYPCRIGYVLLTIYPSGADTGFVVYNGAIGLYANPPQFRATVAGTVDCSTVDGLSLSVVHPPPADCCDMGSATCVISAL